MKRTFIALLLATVTFTMHAKEAVVNGICYYILDDSHVSVVVQNEWDSQSSTMIKHY